MRVLETDRILLKPVEVEDWNYFLNLWREGEVMRPLVHDPLSVKNQNGWLDSSTKSDLALSVFTKDSDPKNIGAIALFGMNSRHQRAILRIRLDPSQQGKGYAKEATNLLLDYGFNILNLNKIISDSFADDFAILNLLTKLGFVQEGSLVQHYFQGGEFRNAIQCGLLRKDFNSKGVSLPKSLAASAVEEYLLEHSALAQVGDPDMILDEV